MLTAFRQRYAAMACAIWLQGHGWENRLDYWNTSYMLALIIESQREGAEDIIGLALQLEEAGFVKRIPDENAFMLSPEVAKIIHDHMMVAFKEIEVELQEL